MGKVPVKQTQKNQSNLPGPGPGRPKGSKNKRTIILQEAIIAAANKAGGDDGIEGYLAKQAEANPREFMQLLGKVLPMQVTGDDEGGPIKVVFTTNYENDSD